MLRTITKKIKETPLTGRVVNALKSLYPEENAPSIQAVLDSIRPKQLLINNDFQINQRGRNSYQTSGYTVDMWHLRHPYMKCDVLDNRIRVEITGLNGVNNYTSFNQSIPDFKMLLGKTMTFVIKVNDIKGLWDVGLYFGYVVSAASLPVPSQDKILKISSAGIYTMTLTIPEDFNYGEYTMLNFSIYTDKEVNNIAINDYIEVEYVDLFEGEIAYPHVKEDYQRDYLKCSQFIQKNMIDGEWKANTSETTGYINIPFRLLPMKNKPTFEIMDTGGNKGKCDRIGVPYSATINQLARVATYEDTLITGLVCELISDSGTSAITIRAYVLATCEPL